MGNEWVGDCFLILFFPTLSGIVSTRLLRLAFFARLWENIFAARPQMVHGSGTSLICTSLLPFKIASSKLAGKEACPQTPKSPPPLPAPFLQWSQAPYSRDPFTNFALNKLLMSDLDSIAHTHGRKLIYNSISVPQSVVWIIVGLNRHFHGFRRHLGWG